MELTASRLRSGITNDLAVVGSFLILGSLSGFLFAWITTIPHLQQFFFITYDKFIIPRYPYWFALSVFQTLGLTTAYLICSRVHRFEIQTRTIILVSSILGLAAPLAWLIVLSSSVSMGLDLVWQFFLGRLIFLVLISTALCALSGNLKLIPIAILWNLFFVLAGGVLTFAVLRVTGIGKDWVDFVLWPTLYAMIGLSFGSWLIWRRDVADASVNKSGKP